ncbi:MAG: hypothetical protein KKH04_00030 [Proteobacteria bacterium]|nr:hypothetical protein [Pseudomonadota bacterium]
MVVAKAEFAQSYMHQLKMIFLRSFSIGPFYHFSNGPKRIFYDPFAWEYSVLKKDPIKVGEKRKFFAEF